MSIERKRLIAALAQGGCIIAHRTVPFPHAYTVTWRDDDFTVEESQAQALVDEKLIAGKPRDALWDYIEFRPTSETVMRSLALSYYPRGFGYCATCGDLLEPCKGTPKHATGPRLAVRHGFQRGPDKKEISPACEGSGKPLVDTLLPAKAVDVAA